jgi:hypothetical protein
MSSKVVYAFALTAAVSILAQLGAAYGSPADPEAPWPIHNGLNHQPTEDELKRLHQEDVTPDQSREIDRLYHELTSTSKRTPDQRPARVPAP